jgi:hypothetical protein
MQSTNAGTMRCPTCRAVQPWSDTCRRCKSDLRLLSELAGEYAALRWHCLANLRQNRIHEALELARQCFALRDDLESRRLLAVCELLNGNWAQVRTHADHLLAEQKATVTSDEQTLTTSKDVAQ